MTIGTFEIRRAHPSDADDIARAHGDSIRSIGPRFYSPTVVADWGEGLTRDLSGRPIGCVFMRKILAVP